MESMLIPMKTSTQRCSNCGSLSLHPDDHTGLDLAWNIYRCGDCGTIDRPVLTEEVIDSYA
jgi:DNA-directed RNA polymerase subunit RPC12/RpoP